MDSVVDYLDEVIDEKMIASCVAAGACDTALNWLRETPRTYLELREHSDDWYLWGVQHVATPLVLERLAADANAGVRRYVAENVNTTAAAMEKLAGDADGYVRSYVAMNVNTTAAVLKRLAGDAVGYVRSYVAENVNTPVTVLERLAVDADVYVRCSALASLRKKGEQR